MTLSDLRDSARSKADEQSTGFISNTQLDRFINQGGRFIHRKITRRQPSLMEVKGTTANGCKFSTVSGTNEYALPSTLIQPTRVEVRFDGSTDEDDWLHINRTQPRASVNNVHIPTLEGYEYSSEFGYYIAGRYLYLKPTPTEVFEVRVWGVHRFVTLALTSDVPTIDEDFHELIAEYASIQTLRASGEDIYKEAMDIFNLELDSMLESIQVYDAQPEQMIITDIDEGF